MNLANVLFRACTILVLDGSQNFSRTFIASWFAVKLVRVSCGEVPWRQHTFQTVWWSCSVLCALHCALLHTIQSLPVDDFLHRWVGRAVIMKLHHAWEKSGETTSATSTGQSTHQPKLVQLSPFLGFHSAWSTTKPPSLKSLPRFFFGRLRGIPSIHWYRSWRASSSNSLIVNSWFQDTENVSFVFFSEMPCPRIPLKRTNKIKSNWSSQTHYVPPRRTVTPACTCRKPVY